MAAIPVAHVSIDGTSGMTAKSAVERPLEISGMALLNGVRMLIIM